MQTTKRSEFSLKNSVLEDLNDLKEGFTDMYENFNTIMTFHPKWRVEKLHDFYCPESAQNGIGIYMNGKDSDGLTYMRHKFIKLAKLFSRMESEMESKNGRFFDLELLAKQDRDKDKLYRIEQEKQIEESLVEQT